MISDLFNKSDVLTTLTREHVKVGDKGYFGDSLAELATEVKHSEVHVLAKIYDDDYTLYPFKGDHHGRNFALFLPANKVKEKVKEPVTYDTYEKAGLIICRMYELKDKLTGNICYRRFFQIYLSDNYNYIRLDGCNLEHLFKNYEIKKDGEFVPFGVKE